MRVLGLDPSLTNFGWAIHDTSATGVDRCPRRGRFRTSAKTLYVARYIELRESLRELIREEKPDKIGIEFPIFNDLFSEGLYGLFLFCSETLYTERQDVVFWSPMQVKAHARESLGRPKGWVMMKPDMVEAAKADLGGKSTMNHNEADAYLNARLSARFWLFHTGALAEEDLTPVECKYFLEVKRFTRGKKAGKEVKKGVVYREDERFFRWSEDDDGTEISSGDGSGTGGTEGDAEGEEGGAAQDG